MRTEALSFFSEEEVARARSYHRPLYWAAAADVAIEASVLGALVWSGGRCARSRLAAVVGADACLRGDRGCRFGGRAVAACPVERFHPRAALGLLDAAVALVGG